jgi:peroxiredoxin
VTKLTASFVVLALLLCAACEQAKPPAVASARAAPAPATATPVLTEQKFRAGMAIDGVKQVVYRDEAGAEIGFDRFLAAVTGGRSFKKEVEGDHSLAILTINPVESAATVAPPRNAALAIPVASAMPALTRSDLSGTRHRLDDGQRYTLLSFFFAECVPCIREIPALNALQARRRGNLQMLSVTFDDRQAAQEFVGKRGLQLPVIAGAQAYIGALGVTSYPTLVLVSPEGRLIGARTAFNSAASVDAGVKDLEDWLASFGVRS